MTVKLKAALYCRVSTEEQNPQNQEDLLMEYCRIHDIDIHNIYMDIYSGTKDNRPYFNLMLSDMRELKFNVIMVTKLDRIGRSLQHILSLFNELENRKVQFIAIQQNIDTTSSAGRLQMQILGAFAEFERNLISERTKDSLKRAKNVGKRGKDKGKRSTLGYFKKRRGTKNLFFNSKI